MRRNPTEQEAYSQRVFKQTPQIHYIRRQELRCVYSGTAEGHSISAGSWECCCPQGLRRVYSLAT